MSEITTRLAKVTCEQSELILGPFDYTRERWEIWASHLDLYGELGEPRMYTLWGPKHDATRTGLGLENIRHPSGLMGVPDVEPCEHYVVFLDWRDDD